MKNKNFSPILLTNNYNSNNSNNKYIAKRYDIMKSLKLLTKKLNFSIKAYYQAIYYIDIILGLEDNKISIPNLKVDLVAIACFLLAGK